MIKAAAAKGNCLLVVAFMFAIANRTAAADTREPIDFETQIVPILTRAGCNAAACHGSAAGRGGFKLSLFGGDAAADYDAIVRQFEGRRVNLAHAGESLILGKPTGRLEHGGGIRLEEDGPSARRLLQWIVAGAPRGGARQLTGFEAGPVRAVVERVGGQVTLRAAARFSDGTAEDVTGLAVFTAADPTAVEIDGDKAVVRRRGQQVLIARFLDRVEPLTLIVPLADQAAAPVSKRGAGGFIDEEIDKELAALRIPASPTADDATYLRRVSLDLTGRLPQPDEVETFLADRSPEKRGQLVDRLLTSDAFVDYWTYRFAQLLRIHTLPNDRRASQTYFSWLRRQIQDAVPFDQVARELLTATGDSHVVGPANFSRTTTDARGQAELVSQVFLGARLACANCHRHPLDRWTQDDYHGLAAVFARLERGRVVALAPRGGVTNLRTGEPAVPRIPGERDLDPDADGCLELAKWIAAPDNPYFARAIVNRLWQAMFGRGLVDPVDDLRDTNPATHPELLQRLAGDFVAHNYNIRHTLRLIALSETYQHSHASTAANSADERFYSHAVWRAMSAEVLADAIADVTGIADRYGEEPLGTRAIALFDAATPAESLDILGRCTRGDSCSGAAVGGGLPARLHQLNGPLVNRKITADAGRMHQWIEKGWTDARIVSDFYLRALSRRPRDEEAAFWQKQLAAVGPTGRAACLEDFVWSLLNCREFTTNH